MGASRHCAKDEIDHKWEDNKQYALHVWNRVHRRVVDAMLTEMCKTYDGLVNEGKVGDLVFAEEDVKAFIIGAVQDICGTPKALSSGGESDEDTQSS